MIAFTAERRISAQNAKLSFQLLLFESAIRHVLENPFEFAAAPLRAPLPAPKSRRVSGKQSERQSDDALTCHNPYVNSNYLPK